MEPSERNFEADIEQPILKNGYIKRLSKDYDRTLCLDLGPLFVSLNTIMRRGQFPPLQLYPWTQFMN